MKKIQENIIFAKETMKSLFFKKKNLECETKVAGGTCEFMFACEVMLTCGDMEKQKKQGVLAL